MRERTSYMRYWSKKSFFWPKKDTVRFTCKLCIYFCKVCVKGENQLEEKMTKPFKQCQLQCSFRNFYGSWLNIYDHLDYGIAKDLVQSTLGKDDAMLPAKWFWIIDLDPGHCKGTYKVPNLYFCYMQKLDYYTSFRACWNEGNLCKTTKDNFHTFRTQIILKPYDYIHHPISIISMTLNMAEGV